MNDLNTFQERSAAYNSVWSVRVPSSVLRRVRALVKASDLESLESVVGTALEDWLSAYLSYVQSDTSLHRPFSRMTGDSVLTVRVDATTMAAVREYADMSGATLTMVATQALTSWCEAQPLAHQRLPVPRSLKRGQRRVAQRIPRDLFVIVDDDDTMMEAG